MVTGVSISVINIILLPLFLSIYHNVLLKSTDKVEQQVRIYGYYYKC